MLTKLEKYIDLSAPANAHVKAKLASAKDLDAAFDILAESGWYISPDLVATIKDDKSSSDKDAEELAKAKELKAKELAKAEAAKAAAKAAEESAKLAKASKANQLDENDKRFD